MDLAANAFIDMTPIIQFAHIYWKYSLIVLVFAMLLIKFTVNGTARLLLSLVSLVCIFNIVVAMCF